MVRTKVIYNGLSDEKKEQIWQTQEISISGIQYKSVTKSFDHKNSINQSIFWLNNETGNKVYVMNRKIIIVKSICLKNEYLVWDNNQLNKLIDNA